MRYLCLLAAAWLVPALAFVAPPVPPAKVKVVLVSAEFAPGIPLPEGVHPVDAVRLDAEVDARGEGKGTLTFQTTPPNYDEYGDLVTGRETDGVDRSRKNVKPPADATP